MYALRTMEISFVMALNSISQVADVIMEREHHERLDQVNCVRSAATDLD